MNYPLPLCNSLEIIDKMLLYPPPTSTSELKNSFFDIFHSFFLGGIFSRPPSLHFSASGLCLSVSLLKVVATTSAAHGHRSVASPSLLIQLDPSSGQGSIRGPDLNKEPAGPQTHKPLVSVSYGLTTRYRM